MTAEAVPPYWAPPAQQPVGAFGAPGVPPQHGYGYQPRGRHGRLPARGGPYHSGAGEWLERHGGLHNLVRQELVTRQLAEQLTRGVALRVLDVGCAEGVQALRLARAGHFVTGIDPDPVTLGIAHQALAAEPPEVRERVQLLTGDGHQVGRWFGPRSFDLVLCHGALMYLPDPEPMLASVARILAPGGLLSLLVRNGDALAMRAGLMGDWRACQESFDSTRYTNRLGLPARADRLAELSGTLAGFAVPVRHWYGVRVFTDAMPDEAAPVDGRQLAQLLDSEERAGKQDPYRHVAALLHVVAEK